MALSNEPSKLAARSKEAEDRAAEAREMAEEAKSGVSDRWTGVQQSWNQAVSSVRDDMADRKAAHKAHRAQRRADRAEDDARFAIDFAYSAIVEPGYAVDATLARKESDDLSETGWRTRLRVFQGPRDTARRPPSREAAADPALRP